MLKKLFMRFALLACCLSVVSVWGKSFSIDLRTPTAKTAKQIRAKSNVIALPQGADGTLRKVNLAARAADVGVVAVGDELTFTLFDDVTITLTLKKKMPSPLGGEVFIAEASGYDGVKNAVVLRTAEGLTVDVQDYRNRKVYRVISTATGVMVQEMEAKGGKCGCDALDPPNLTDKASTKLHKIKKVVAAKNVESDETCVDILVAYDTNAATWANANGGGVTNFAQMAVQRMNTVLANNGLDWAFRFRLVGIAQVSTSSANLDSTLDAATNGSGDWAPIKAKRDDVGADIVTVLIDTGTAYGTTGLGWSLRTTDFESFAESAYNVCAIRSVAQSHTMTHEVGHNMGCGHSDEMADRSNCGPQLYDYSAGCYITEWFPVEEGSEWSSEKKLHTIMAYDDNGYGDIYEEIPYFSSAEKQYTCNGKSIVVGDETHDNTRTLENTYAAASTWRAQKVPMTYDVQFTPVSGTIFAESITVRISSQKEGAEIRYTLDGSEPTTASPIYSGPIELTESANVRAVALVDGICGIASSAEYIKADVGVALGLPDNVWTVSTSPEWHVDTDESLDGMSIRADITEENSVVWVQTTIEGPCTLSFKTHGNSSKGFDYHLSCDADELFKEYAWGIDCNWESTPYYVEIPEGAHTVRFWARFYGLPQDEETSFWLDSFRIYRVAKPVFVPGTTSDFENATAFDEELRVAIECADSAAKIYYTLDGSDPEGNEALEYDGPFYVTNTITVRAVARLLGEDGQSAPVQGIFRRRHVFDSQAGRWTGDVAGAFAAAEGDGRMVAVLCMNYAGCWWSQRLEPILRDASFLAWTKANGVYLVNTDPGWLDGDAADEDIFRDLYRGSSLYTELHQSLYYPTFCFAAPDNRNACLGVMLARNDGEHKTNGIAYEDTPESLIACFASMLGKMPLGAPVATVTEGQVTLVNTNGTGTLYYTLDGSAPTRERGMIYGGAVTVPVGATLQAVVWPDDVDDVSGITFTYENEDFGMKMGIPGMIWQNDDQHPWKTDGTGRVSIDGTNVSKLVVRVSSPGVISFQMGYHYGGDIELSVNGTEIGCCDAWSRVSQEIENPDGGEITWTFKPSAWCDAPEAWLNELKWSPLPDSPIVRAEGGSVNYGTLIRWDDVYGAIKYLVYRATVNDTSAAVKVAETTQCRFWDSDSKDGSKYWYWVKTVNDYGESNFSMGILAGVRSISVSFDANGGSGIMATQMFVGDVAQALAKNTFTREGYVFLGWTTSAGGEVVYMDGQDLAVVSDMTLYAVWEMANLAAFTIEDGVLTDVKLNGATVIAIPDGVSAIADNVFAQLRGLKGVTIPDGVTSIGSSAFWCAGLMNVTIPDSVTSIGSCAFSWCESLGSATIGNGVTSIGYCMFENCSKLVNVTLPETLRSIESGAFYRCTSLRNIKIPAGMAYIDDTAFSGCINLTVHAPSTLRDTFSVPATCTIEYYDVPEYTVTFNANGGTLGEGVLTQIAVPQGQAIRELPVPTRLFYNFAGWFTSKTGGDRITEETILSADATLYAHWTSTADGWEWEYYDNGDGTVTVYDSVDFYNTPTSIEFPAEINGKPVVAIENNCGSRQMSEPTTISIPASVKKIGLMAFAGYQNLDTVIFYGDESKIEIDKTAFVRTDYLRNRQPFEIRVLRLDDMDGYVVGYQGRPGATISASDWPAGVSAIFDSAFAFEDNLIRVELPRGVKTIFDNALRCENLEEIILNDDLEIIDAGAFQACSSLKEITVPASVTSIGDWAFWACTSLKKVYLPETLRGKLSDNVFEDCSAELEVIYYEVDEPPPSAVWTVTFDANGGSLEPVSYTRSVEERAVIGTLPTPIRTGYTFTGWFTAASGGTQISASTKVTANVTYYAHWTADGGESGGGESGGGDTPTPGPAPATIYTVTFNANGGSVSPTTRAVTSGAAVGTLPTPTLSGYTFDGWFTAANGGTKVSASTAVTGNVTYYAHWTANGGGSGGGDTPTPTPTPTTYTVTLNANGGRVSPMTRAVTSGAAVGTLPTPTRSGYIFDGWFTAANGGTKVSASTAVTGNVTYYAHWTANGGGSGGGNTPEPTPTPTPAVVFAGTLDVAFAKAQTVDGALYKGNALAGTVQVKVGKINKKGVVKVSATATMLIDGKVKKVTAKAVNVMLDATGRVPPVKVVFKVPIGEMAFEMAADGTFTLKNASYLMAEATIGKELKGGSHGTFRMDGFDLAVPGELLDDLLPNEESFSVSNGKWVFAKAATVKWAKDRVTKEYGIVVDDSKGKTNLSGLKLTYATKTGQFKGSFKVYALEEKNGKTKLVKYTVNVIGFVVDGVGYGEASCKKPAATWSVTVK